ncbi:MAG: ATP-dependent DNA helicase [Actinomycetaceae bacterium]|nr:ATP-dependent DNA helicase [Actinomycetaceae bacterium]
MKYTHVLRQVIANRGGTERVGQQQMAGAIADLPEGAHLLVQAGTGTGKSFAYLVPTLCKAAQSGERAIISTATLVLQRQLISVDIPAVCQAMEENGLPAPTVALLKGWNNYACKQKTAVPEDGLFDAAAATALGKQVIAARKWVNETKTGDRDDMTPGVSDQVWRQISVTSTECLGERCHFASECFARAAREAATQADIIVTNHSMLGVEAMNEINLLPDVDTIIIDEAHELDDRIRSQGTVEISAKHLINLAKLTRRAGSSATALENAATALATALDTCAEGRLPEISAALADALSLVGTELRGVHSDIGSPGEGVEGQKKRRARAEINTTIENVELIRIDDPLVRVNWVARGTEDQVVLRSAPLEVARPLANHIYAGKRVVATSATLALGGSFDAMATRLGFNLLDWQALDVGSPFDYGRQGILYVARHLPPPGREGFHFEDELVQLVQASEGGALCLFSSRAAAAHATEILREKTDFTVYAQGEEYLATLVEQFKETSSAVLVGTISLWQGVDIPGAACRLVTIDRIPFPRPDDPVASALSEAAVRNGGNGFMQVSLVNAALLLAQGAGRLIRRSDDKGIVAVLDSRLVTKRYGKFLHKSLPPMWATTNKNQVLGALGRLAKKAKI